MMISFSGNEKEELLGTREELARQEIRDSDTDSGTNDSGGNFQHNHGNDNDHDGLLVNKMT